jgi:hypothetical protein
VAIEVCLLFNIAVVFNLIVFPFPPSKAQSLGDVPMNRKNAANCSHGNLNLKMGILRQDIDATMHLAPIGNSVRICCVYNFQVLFGGFFSVCHASPIVTQDDSVRQ